MTPIRYTPLPTPTVEALRAGGPDAYGQPPEHGVSNGSGNPCRHCLRMIPEGASMLILAHRPFDGLHPNAETGPIFLCADACAAYDGDVLPPVLQTSPDYLLKGYTADHRISYGTGRVTPSVEIEAYASTLLEDPKIAFVDVRSARNNCFALRITRKS